MAMRRIINYGRHICTSEWIHAGTGLIASGRLSVDAAMLEQACVLGKSTPPVESRAKLRGLMVDIYL